MDRVANFSTYQWRPCVLSDLWSRCGGVHVAEKVLDPPKGNAAALVTHLQTGESGCVRSLNNAEPQKGRGDAGTQVPVCRERLASV